jgi:hypothetical protein
MLIESCVPVSHLAQPCEVFHNCGGKTCGTLINRNHDARPELGDTIEVATSTRVEDWEQSWDIRPKSYNRSHEYDQSRDVPVL